MAINVQLLIQVQHPNPEADLPRQPHAMLTTARIGVGVLSSSLVLAKYPNILGVEMTLPYITLITEGIEPYSRSHQRSKSEHLAMGLIEVVSASVLSAVSLIYSHEEGDLPFGLGQSLVYAWVATEGVRNLFIAYRM